VKKDRGEGYGDYSLAKVNTLIFFVKRKTQRKKHPRTNQKKMIILAAAVSEKKSLGKRFRCTIRFLVNGSCHLVKKVECFSSCIFIDLLDGETCVDKNVVAHLNVVREKKQRHISRGTVNIHSCDGMLNTDYFQGDSETHGFLLTILVP
jgi:hypothetical protein